MSKVSCEAAGKPERAALRMARAELLTAVAKGKPERAALRMARLNCVSYKYIKLENKRE